VQKKRGVGGVERNEIVTCFHCSTEKSYRFFKQVLLLLSVCHALDGSSLWWMTHGWVIMNPEMIDPSMTLGKSKKCSHKQDKLMSSQAL
jgi:hypothetical protein